VYLLKDIFINIAIMMKMLPRRETILTVPIKAIEAEAEDRISRKLKRKK
jgi:hypothetical protein